MINNSCPLWIRRCQGRSNYIYLWMNNFGGYYYRLCNFIEFIVLRPLTTKTSHAEASRRVPGLINPAPRRGPYQFLPKIPFFKQGPQNHETKENRGNGNVLLLDSWSLWPKAIVILYECFKVLQFKYYKLMYMIWIDVCVCVCVCVCVHDTMQCVVVEHRAK